MKPKVIYMSEMDGIITMTKEDMESLLEDMYNAGYADGMSTPRIIIPASPTGTPGTQPQRKNGKWFHVQYVQEYKYQCNQCGRFHRAMYDFCPSCGADMREGEQDG